LIDYYVNFIKSLVIKLDHETVNFFFNDRVKIFPLYTRALEFHNYKDQTVKTVVRTIVLSIHKINSKEMLDML
jgi:protein CLEC16A